MVDEPGLSPSAKAPQIPTHQSIDQPRKDCHQEQRQRQYQNQDSRQKGQHGIDRRQERRRRWSTDQKLTMVRESLEPGQSVSVVARRNGINANQLFLWRKLYQDGSLSAVSAGEAVVPASELSDALKQIRELQRMLGKKTMEAEVLKEAVEIARSRKWIAHSPLLPGDDQ